MRSFARCFALTTAAATITMVSLIAAPLLPAQRRGARGRGGESAATGGAGAMVKREVKDAKSKQAVCNDGSPLAYYFGEGKGDDRRKWIIFLQGGEGCATDAACTERWTARRNLMTSVGLKNSDAGEGILSTDAKTNPDFARFTHVRVHYCSSDAYAGDAARTIGGRTFEFRGRRGIDGLLDDLMDKSQVGSSTLRDATEVLFTGSSAGGMGVQNNLDRVASRLSWATVKGVADSGWIPDVPKLNSGPGTIDVRPDAPEALAYYRAQPDESCVAANGAQAGKCLLGSFVFKYITTPMFVYADQRDPSHLGSLGARPRSGADTQAYIQRYMQLVRESLQDVPAAFGPILGAHMALQNERFQSAVIDGHSFAETLGNWYFGRPGPVKLIATAR
jgi:O-palmitoleoyl-L-serine hydrolase